MVRAKSTSCFDPGASATPRRTRPRAKFPIHFCANVFHCDHYRRLARGAALLAGGAATDEGLVNFHHIGEQLSIGAHHRPAQLVQPGPRGLIRAQTEHVVQILGRMLHSALAGALACAHIDDLHRAAARWHTIRLAHRAAHEPRVAAAPTAIQRSASESVAWTSCAPAAGMTPTETACSPMAMPIRRRRPLGAASRKRSGIEIVMSPCRCSG